MTGMVGPQPLDRAHVLSVLAAHADELRRLGARSLALFGSVARGDESASSDIDLLVELRPKTFDSYMDVKLFLEKVLGHRVDLVLADAVKPRLHGGILAEAIRAEIEAEREWEPALANQQDALDRLAGEALREHAAGRTQPLDLSKR